MIKSYFIPMKDLVSGMSFTAPLCNKYSEVLLPEYYPLYPDFIKEWKNQKYDGVFTTGNLISRKFEFGGNLPGYISLELRQLIQQYYNDLASLKMIFEDLNRFSIKTLNSLQSIGSFWVCYLTVTGKAENFLKVIRYANPNEEDYFYAHMLDIMLISLGISSFYKKTLMNVYLMQIAIQALLCNVGMLLLPETLLDISLTFDNKQKKEFERHTILGHEFLVNILNSSDIFAIAALQHHERPDGSGYPRGLTEEYISSQSLIISLADIFAAQIRGHGIQKAKEPAEILKDLLYTTIPVFQGNSKNYIRAFLNYMTIYPVTSILELNTGDIVIVTHTNIKHPTKPTVMFLLDKNKNYYANHREICLADKENKHIFIKGIFDREYLFSKKELFVKHILTN